jgi:hypothetical protein
LISFNPESEKIDFKSFLVASLLVLDFVRLKVICRTVADGIIPREDGVSLALLDIFMHKHIIKIMDINL